MSSTHKTQLRLHQISTGSVSLDSSAANTDSMPSLKEAMDQMATAIKNISGKEFHSTSAGGFSQDPTFTSTTNGANGAELKLSHQPGDGPQNNNEAGQIKFEGLGGGAGSGTDVIEAGKITAKMTGVSDGTEISSLNFNVHNSDDDDGDTSTILKLKGGADDAAMEAEFKGAVALGDDIELRFGLDTGDPIYAIDYDESGDGASGTDSLVMKSMVEAADFKLTMAADQYDDAGDAWQTHIAATDGKISWSNDIGSKGTFVEHFSITPNSAVAASTAAFKGSVTIDKDLTVAGDLNITGMATTLDVHNLRVEDQLIVLNRTSNNDTAAERQGFAGFGAANADMGLLFQRMNDAGDKAVGRIAYTNSSDSTAASNKLVEGDSFVVTAFDNAGSTTARTFYVVDGPNASNPSSGFNLVSSAVRATETFTVASGNTSLTASAYAEKDRLTITSYHGTDNRTAGQQMARKYALVSAGRGGDATIQILSNNGIKDAGGDETVIKITDAQNVEQTFTFGSGGLAKGADVNATAGNLAAAISAHASFGCSVSTDTITVVHSKNSSGNFPGDNTSSQSKPIKITNGFTSSTAGFRINNTSNSSQQAEETFGNAFNSGGHQPADVNTGDLIFGVNAGVAFTSATTALASQMVEDVTFTLQDKDGNAIVFTAKDAPDGSGLQFKSQGHSDISTVEDIFNPGLAGSLAHTINAHSQFTVTRDDGPLGRLRLIINHSATGGNSRTVASTIGTNFGSFSSSTFKLTSTGAGSATANENGHVAVKVNLDATQTQTHAGAAGGLQRDLLVQIKAAIEHANGHGSQITVGNVDNLSGAGALNVVLTQQKHGATGNITIARGAGFTGLNSNGALAFENGANGPDTGTSVDGMPPLSGVIKGVVVNDADGSGTTAEGCLDQVAIALEAFETDVGAGFVVDAKSVEGDGHKVVITQGGRGVGGNLAFTEDIKSSNWTVTPFAGGGNNAGLSGQPAIFFDESDDIMMIGMAERTTQGDLATGSNVVLEANQVLPVGVDKLILSSSLNNNNFIDIKNMVDLRLSAATAIVTAAEKPIRFVDGQSGDNERYAGIVAPNNIGNSYDLKLPVDLPSGDRLLQSDSSGNLSFVSAGSAQDSRNHKSAISVPTEIKTGQKLDSFDGALNLILPADSFVTTDADQSVKDASAMVFVNGQLLMSGSRASVLAGTADYRFMGTGTLQSSGSIRILDDAKANVNGDSLTFPLFETDIDLTDVKNVAANPDAILVVQGKEGTDNRDIILKNVVGDAITATDNVVAGDVVLINGIYLKVASLQSKSGTADAMLRTTKIDGTAWGANDLDSISAGQSVKIAAKKQVIFFRNNSSPANGTLHSTDGEYGATGTGEKLRRSLVVAINAAGNKEAIAAQLQSAIENSQLNMTATVSTNNVIISQPLFDTRANGAVIVSSDAADVEVVASFAGGTATGRHTLEMAFDIESGDVVTVITR